MDKDKKKWQKWGAKALGFSVLMCLLTFICAIKVYAAETPDLPNGFELNIATNAGSSSLSATLQILLMITILSMAPAILLMVTSFTRIVVVLHFVRAALGTQTTPPNQVMIGLALFLTFFIMGPTFSEVNTNAIQPLTKGAISQEEAIEAGLAPIRQFMFSQLDDGSGNGQKDLRLFIDIAQIPQEELESPEDIPTTVLIPAFMINELRKAFTIGFLIYIPFIIMDMVVASTLMSMGMMMLPPTTISMPFKILLFILADGWNLVIGSLVSTFYG